ERRRAGEHLDVAGPAEALVALRAVGGHVQEVAACGPDDVLVQLVHQRFAAPEPTGAAQVGADHLGGHLLGAQVAGPGHLGVPEAVEGETGGQVVAAGGQLVAVGGGGAAQRPGAQLTVGEHLGVPQAYDGGGRLRRSRTLVGAARPFRARYVGQVHPADQVLPEVGDV